MSLFDDMKERLSKIEIQCEEFRDFDYKDQEKVVSNKRLIAYLEMGEELQYSNTIYYQQSYQMMHDIAVTLIKVRKENEELREEINALKNLTKN